MFVSLLLPGLIAITDVRSDVIFDNGSFVTHTSGGANNAARSEVEDNLRTLGISCFAGRNHRLADDFTVPESRQYEISAVRFQIYERNEPNPSIRWVRLRIWNGSPQWASEVVHDEIIPSPLLSLESTNTYRLFRGTGDDDASRLIFNIKANLKTSVKLASGTYWLDWTIQSRWAEEKLQADRDQGNSENRIEQFSIGVPVSVMVTSVGHPTRTPANALKFDPWKKWTRIGVGDSELPQELCFQLFGKVH